ncbi:MAG: lytic transglycosylase domain-containing protein [Bacteroidaceae bacterium]|jgi:membrane-bound lytic murein transglycosylase D|nr:lytic transglycosylase domain-containing protein [Bacteroidaceae bacterium]
MKKKWYIMMAITAMSFGNAYAQSVITVEDEDGDTEDIEMPEGMTVEADSILQEYDNKTRLAEGNSNSINDLPYDDQILVDRLAHIPTTIEMPLNNITRKFIDQYCNRMKNSVAVMLGSANFYMPFFEEALEHYGLPLELKFLPVIESALRPTAQSHAGAVGLWQFMLATGKTYGLEINTLVDERRDPVKSSYAAAHFLSDLYEKFGDWGLAIAAYNCGENAVSKALLRAGGNEGDDYWSIYNQLPRETRGYVPAFIAATYIMNYYCEHGITPMEASLPTETDTVVVTKEVGFSQVASVCGVTVDELRALNPQYRRDIVPVDYALRMPDHAIEAFILNEDSIYASSSVMRRRVIEDINEAPAATTRARTATRTTRTTKARTASRGRKTTAAKRSTARKSTARKSTARKATAKKAPAKKTSAKRSSSSKRRRR